jgi:hypothetical protein
MMNMVDHRTDIAINTTNAVLGSILFASPWLLGFRHETWASLNAWVSGGIVVFIALLALVRTYDWEEWLNVIAGLWITTSPWMLWFEDVSSAFWAHVIIGLSIIAFAALEVCRLYLASKDALSTRRQA